MEAEKEFPKYPMGFDPQKGFMECDKAGDVQDRIWRDLVKLHAVNKKKPTEEFVGRERKTTQKKSKEHHPIAARELGDAFGAGEDDLLPSDEESIPLALEQIEFFEFQRNPTGRRVSALLLHHRFLVSDSLYRHLEEVRSGAARKLRSSREMQQWWRRKNKELVNSKNHSLPLIKLPVKGTWAEMWCKKRKR
jgi:hypothetical protein